ITLGLCFEGGIGASSRKLPQSLGGFTVGVLVQTNFGGILTINGAPVGQELGQYYLKEEISSASGPRKNGVLPHGDAHQVDPTNELGSIIMVIGTDAPVDARNLRRMAARAMLGLARTSGVATHGS